MHMDPQTEAKLAPMLAQAAQRLLAQNQAQTAQQQAQQQAQDPIIQMQQQELAIKQRAQQAKEVKDAAELELKNKQINIDAMKAAGTLGNQRRIADKQAMVTAVNSVAQRQHEAQMHKKDLFAEGLKTTFQQKGKQPKGE